MLLYLRFDSLRVLVVPHMYFMHAAEVAEVCGSCHGLAPFAVGITTLFNRSSFQVRSVNKMHTASTFCVGL